MSRIFIKNGYYCQINRDKGESYDNFIKRGYFVASQKPSTIEQYEYLITMSRIWLNIKLYNSQYSQSIKNIVLNMEKNI